MVKNVSLTFLSLDLLMLWMMSLKDRSSMTGLPAHCSLHATALTVAAATNRVFPRFMSLITG